MRDNFTRDEAGAAAHARLLGAHEHIGSGVGDQEPDPVLDKAAGADPWADPPTTPRPAFVPTDTPPF